MYVIVSTTNAAAGGSDFGADTAPVPPSAYAVPITHTIAVTATASNTAHHGVSGYIGFGDGGSPGTIRGGAFIVYFKRVVLWPIHNNGESASKTPSTSYCSRRSPSRRFRRV
jgi:hypothetical protein